MKRKRLILSMALAGACFQTGSAFAQVSDRHSVLKSSSVGRIGDGAASIGDDSDTVRNAIMTPDARPNAFRENAVDPSIPSAPLPADPVPAGSYIAHDPQPIASAPASNDAGYVSSCGDGCGVQMCCVAPAVGNTMWAEGDVLLWFSGRRPAPPLVTRHPTPGQVPNLGNPGTEILAGGPNDVGDGLLTGFRTGFGMWLDESQSLGAGGRVFGLFGKTDSNTFTFDGNRSIGVPFFNTSLGLPFAYQVGRNLGVNGSDTGSATVATDLDLIASELYIRNALIKNSNSRLDLTTGYLFARLDDSLVLSTDFTDGVTNAIANGTRFTTVDEFTGQNTFHGGQIGLLSEFQSGKWFFSSGSKFGLGNMNQKVIVRGQSQSFTPAGVPLAPTTNGILAHSSNSGVTSDNVFTFIPQVDLKIGYQMNSRARFDLGYSFLYFGDVVLGGGQIDSNVDLANINVGPLTPVRRFETDSLILHGVNLGLTYSF